MFYKCFSVICINANDAKTFLKHFSDCLFYFCSTCADSITEHYKTLNADETAHVNVMLRLIRN